MRIAIWKYIILVLDMLFVHPFYMLWEFCHGRCSAGVLVLVLAESFITPLILYTLLYLAIAPAWLMGLLFILWAGGFSAVVYKITRLVRIFADLESSAAQFVIQLQGTEDAAEVSEELGSVVEDLYGWRPGPSEIRVKREGENLVCDILSVVLCQQEVPGRTADRIRNEFMRRRYGTK